MNKKFKPSFWKHQLRQKYSIKTKKFSSLTDNTSVKRFNLKALSFENINPFRIFSFFNNSSIKPYYNKKIIKIFCKGNLLYADMIFFLNTNSNAAISFHEKRLVDLQLKDCSRPVCSFSLIFSFHVSL